MTPYPPNRDRPPTGHAWNVLPDGRHIDFTFDQFREGEGLAPEIVTEPVIDVEPDDPFLGKGKRNDAAA